VPQKIGHVSLLVFGTVNLDLRASYRHDGRGQLPTDLVVTPPIKALTGETSRLGLPLNPGIKINPTFSHLISIEQD
jgi:hypothetical protein